MSYVMGVEKEISISKTLTCGQMEPADYIVSFGYLVTFWRLNSKHCEYSCEFDIGLIQNGLKQSWITIHMGSLRSEVFI